MLARYPDVSKLAIRTSLVILIGFLLALLDDLQRHRLMAVAKLLD